VVCSNRDIRAAANTIVNAVCDAALLVPAANVAVSGLGESHAVTVSIISKTAGTTAAAVDSLGHGVVKTVAGLVSTAASAAVSNLAHATAMAMCAAESAMSTCEVTIVLNSEIASWCSSFYPWESGRFDSYMRSWQYC
jgi:hypothetical protein